MARSVASGKIARGIAVCGSGVGACVAINKIRGIRACLITDPYSARQGVEDDDMNIICLGGRIIGQELALELVNIFLSARFSGAERHKRRLGKIARLESG
jgi:ribose 5-phosphate isomerase B